MSLLKYLKDINKDGANEWITFYAAAIRNRLRRDKNLSDLTNVVEARHALEIFGDNNQTHFHDSRYVPMIEKEAAEREKADKRLDKKIDDTRKALEEEMAQMRKEIEQEMKDLKQDIANELAQTKADIDKALAEQQRENQNAMNVLSSHVDSAVGKIGQGGIAAAGLGSNGWIRFVNGLIMQWGTGGGALPIPFSAPLVAVCTPRNSSYCYESRVWLTSSQIVIDSWSANNGWTTCSWIAIGY